MRIFLAGNNINDITTVNKSINVAFYIKDLGKFKYFMGLEIARSREGIHICQRKYVLDILKDIGMLGAKLVATPMQKQSDRLFNQEDVIHDITTYGRTIGHLLYLVSTQPNICFSVLFLSQYVHKPSTYHHQAMQRVLRYIKTSLTHGIFYPKSSTLHLKAFSDSDRASCSMTRRSTTGLCIFLGE